MNLYEAVGVTVIIMACEFAMYAVLFLGFLLILKIVDKFFGDIETVKAFCTKVLFPHSQPYDEWEPFSEDPSSYFYGYHTFEKIKDNKYRYRVVKPYMD